MGRDRAPERDGGADDDKLYGEWLITEDFYLKKAAEYKPYAQQK